MDVSIEHKRSQFHKSTNQISPIKKENTSRLNLRGNQGNVENSIKKTHIDNKSFKSKTSALSLGSEPYDEQFGISGKKSSTKNLNGKSSSKFVDLKDKKKPTSVLEHIKYPKNINEYRHIMSNFQTVEAEMAWVLDLRTYADKIEYTGLKNSCQPKFYDDDLAKYKKSVDMEKALKRSNLTSASGNINGYKHLLKDRVGATPNASQIGFETTLRNLNKNENLQDPWKPVANTVKSRIFSSYLPPMRPDSSVNLKNLSNVLCRPFVSVYDNVVVGGKIVVKRRKFQPNTNETIGFLGEHNGMDKYEYKYDNARNVNEIRHLLCSQSNSMANFEVGLRSYDTKKRDETRQFIRNNLQKNKKNDESIEN